MTLTVLLWPRSTSAQLEWVAAEPSPMVFPGPCEIPVTIRNPSDQPAQLSIRRRLFQLSSSMAMPAGPAEPWKDLHLLAGQTAIETVKLTVPEIKGGTRFQIAWLDDGSKVLGKTDFIAWPADLLKRLKEFGGDKPFGVYDPDEQLIPLLKRLEIPFEHLKDLGALPAFRGRYAILGPFREAPPAVEALTKNVLAAARQGVAIVWIQAPVRSILPETTQIKRVEKATIVVAPGSTVANLGQSARSQANLLSFVQSAVAADQFELPKTEK